MSRAAHLYPALLQNVFLQPKRSSFLLTRPFVTLTSLPEPRERRVWDDRKTVRFAFIFEDFLTLFMFLYLLLYALFTTQEMFNQKLKFHHQPTVISNLLLTSVKHMRRSLAECSHCSLFFSFPNMMKLERTKLQMWHIL